MVEASFKHFTQGTHRVCDPEETVRRIMAQRERYGITRIADITGLDHLGIPVVSAYRPNSRSLVTAQGKGCSLNAAKASAVMEAVEAYHAERVRLPLTYSSYRELRSAQGPSTRVVDPSRLPKTKDSAFHPDAQLLWVKGQDLMSLPIGFEDLSDPGLQERAQRAAIWVPFECVHTNFTLPLPAGSGCFMLTSNGLASGNQLLEAVSHGVCEVVERHANTLWQIARGTDQETRARMRLETVQDSLCRDVLDRFERGGIAVAAWDITSEVAIPTYLVEIVDAEDNPARLLYATSGLGCHLSPQIALLRALTEAAQCRLTFIAGARDDSDREIYEQARNVTAIARARERIIQSRQSDGQGSSFAEVVDRSGSSLKQDVETELQSLALAGYDQVIVVDLSHAETGVSVVRVIVPGLEGIHDVQGYVPGVRARQKQQERAS